MKSVCTHILETELQTEFELKPRTEPETELELKPRTEQETELELKRETAHGLNLKTVELCDKSWIDALSRVENSRSADFNFSNIYIWDASYRQQVASSHGRLIVMPRYNKNVFFAFPIGGGELEPVVEDMRAYTLEHGLPLRILGVTKEHKEELEHLFPGRFRFNETRALYDYIYRAEKLASLSGKKLHGKRNHINRFVEQNDWSYQEMTVDVIPECVEMLEFWLRENSALPQNELLSEFVAIMRGFKNFTALGLEGGVLRTDGRIIAFSIGEPISDDTYNIHFEKAFSDVQGAYQMINREYARQIMENHPRIEYINREDDLGKENLRKAKLSYYPDILLEKYAAIWD